MRAKTAQDRQLLELIDPIAESLGLEVVRVRLMSGSRRQRLQIMAERPSDHDISVEQCAKLSRAVSEVFDAADPISGEYLLEVSSPGIDRPLTRPIDFDLFEGEEARLETDRMIEGRKRFKGVLAGVDEGKVAFDIEGEEDTALFPLEWIASAQLVLTEELIKQTMKADKEARQTTGEDEMETSQ